MKEQEIPQPPECRAEMKLDPSAICDRCHRFGAYRFSDQILCGECYEEGGSCCLEFGADDLWETDKDFAGHRR